MLNVKYLVSPDRFSDDRFEQVFVGSYFSGISSIPVVVYLYKDHLPRAWFPGEVVALPDSIDVVMRLAELAYDPAEIVYVREAALARQGNGAGRVKASRWNPDHIRLELELAASALLVVSEAKLKQWGLMPLARVVDWVTVGCDPRRMGLGPVPAVERLLEKTGERLEAFDLVELNEAFAVQVLACDHDLRFDHERLNVNGGAIALGHPIGCSGARIVTTLVHEMQRRKSKKGLATLCVSGGLGMALSLERT